MDVRQEIQEKGSRLVGQLHRGESFSEPNLTTAWKGRSGRHLHGFPPGFTVDELRWYRKKKPPGEWGGPQDNLKTEDGSMKKFKSEYKRCYRHFKFLPASSEDLTDTQEEFVEKRNEIRPFDYLKLEGDFEYNPEYRDLFIEYPLVREDRIRGPGQNIQLEESMEKSVGITEKQDKYISFESVPKTQLVKRSSNLQHEGEFMVKSSEMHSQFIKHEDVKKADISRRPTNLRMEGEISVSTETSDKYSGINLEQREKPLLKKAPTNLKLEGNFDTLTEKNEKFVPFELSKRQKIQKRPTNLHLEGSLEIQTEKQDKYIPFKVQERPQLIKKHTNLHLEGEMSVKSEKQDKYVSHTIEKRPALTKRDTNLQLEGTMETQSEKKDKYVPYELSTRQKIQKRPTNLQLSGEMDTTTEKSSKYIPFDHQKRPPLIKTDTNLQLEGTLIMTPEYREEFIEHHIERTKPKRPVNNLGIHIDDDIDTDRKKDNFFEEYQKPYRNLNKENIPHKKKKDSSLDRDPEGKKPDGQPEGDKTKVVSFSLKATRLPEDVVGTEIQQKRTRGLAQIGNLKSEGRMELSAEYRSEFVDFPRERPIVKKPEGSLKTTGHVSHLSEKSSQYISHGIIPRTTITRPEDSLKMTEDTTVVVDDPQALGSRFECQPEYRKAYNDFLQRENITRKPRKLINDVEAEKSKIPLPQFRRPQKVPGTASSTKSRSISPADRRKLKVPHTPQQQRILVPDMGQFTPRRPSSIFGPKTGRWYPRTVSPEPERPGGHHHRHCSDDEWDCPGSHRCSSCCEGCCKCRRRSITRWESPCGRRGSFQASSPKYHSPSPPRRLWSRGQDHQPEHHLQTVEDKSTSPPRRLWSRGQDHQSGHHPHRVEDKSTSPPSRLWSRNQDHQSGHHPQKVEEKPASFVVLTDKVEINNNRLQGAPGGFGGPVGGGGGGGAQYCKEQKWMPPWYEPPM